MSEKFFPFDSVNGDRSYLAKDFRKYFKTIITSGVFAGGDNLPVRSAGGLNITVGLGFAWVEGALYEVEGTPLPFALAPGAANPRIDRVVVRLDIAERKVYSTVIQGTPAASPVAPALVRNGDFYDLGLASITVPASAISITDSAIQDTRTDSAVCGVVRSPVEVLDVDAFMVNCQTAFDEWFANLEEQFSGDVAGNLQNQIKEARDGEKVSLRGQEQYIRRKSPAPPADPPPLPIYARRQNADRGRDRGARGHKPDRERDAFLDRLRNLRPHKNI